MCQETCSISDPKEVPFTSAQQGRDWLISCFGVAPESPQEQPHHTQDPRGVQLCEERGAGGCAQQALYPGLQGLIQHACGLQANLTLLLVTGLVNRPQTAVIAAPDSVEVSWRAACEADPCQQGHRLQPTNIMICIQAATVKLSKG